MARIRKRIISGVASALSAPSRARSKARGVAADLRRGHLLYKQGFGGKRESALSIAKKGKKGGRKRKPMK